MSYKIIKSEHLDQKITYHKPEASHHERITLESPAMSVMTDLKKISLVTINRTESIDTANDKMKAKGIRLLVVSDVHEQVEGIITATDIMGEKPIKFLKQNGGKRADIQVADIMNTNIEVVTIKDISSAKIGDIIQTLKSVDRQHALVTDNQGINNAITIRGIISLNQIARQIGVDDEEFHVSSIIDAIQRN